MTDAKGEMSPRRSWAEARLVVFVLAGLLLVAILAVLTSAQHGPPLSIYSTDPDGGMALRLWLEKLGYPVHEWTPDDVPRAADTTLFVLAPTSTYSDRETAKIHQWVSSGHTLVVAGEETETVNSLLKAFNVSLDYAAQKDDVAPAQPSFLLHPPLGDVSIPEQGLYHIRSSRPDEKVYLLDKRQPVIASYQEGKGTLWVFGLPYALSNIGLQDANDASLSANLIHLLQMTPDEGVMFDESKHGFTPASSLSGRLFTTASGWGIVLAVALTMAFLALRGRRFGKAIPLPEDRLRREPVEYIQAIASLFRRSGQRDDILAHYRTQFRRRLSEYYAVDPRLEDDEMITAIAFHDPTVDEVVLRHLFDELARRGVSETGLVSAATDMDKWLKTLR